MPVQDDVDMQVPDPYGVEHAVEDPWTQHWRSDGPEQYPAVRKRNIDKQKEEEICFYIT